MKCVGLKHMIYANSCCRFKHMLNQFIMLILLSVAAILLLINCSQDRSNVRINSSMTFRLWRFWSQTRLTGKGLHQLDATTSSPTTDSPTATEERLALIRNGSVNCKDIQSLFPNRIPPVIHWTNKDSRVLHQHQSIVETWRNVLGDSVAYMYWEDKDVEKLLVKHYSSLLPAYRHLRVGLMRSDIARLIILHHVGGVYTDLDVTLQRSFHDLMTQHTALWSQEPVEHVYYMYNRLYFLSNALFMTKARHKYLDYVLKSWPSWFQSNWWNRMSQLSNPNQAIYITGPVMLNQFLDNYYNFSRHQVPASIEDRIDLAHPDQFQPVWDSWFAQNIAKRQCQQQRHTMLPEHRQHCDLLNARRFVLRPLQSNVTYGVHRFLHTSYGRKNSYNKAKAAKDILPLSTCII